MNKSVFEKKMLPFSLNTVQLNAVYIYIKINPKATSNTNDLTQVLPTPIKKKKACKELIILTFSTYKEHRITEL